MITYCIVAFLNVFFHVVKTLMIVKANKLVASTANCFCYTFSAVVVKFIAESDMVIRGRQREFAEARAIVAWLAYHYTPMTLTSIGKRLGRDHVVMIHYNRMVDSWLDEPRRNLRGARITTKLIRELDDFRESNRSTY